MFTHQNYSSYVIYDYPIYLIPEIRQALWKQGYILVIIGRGITGFVQVNDTHLHWVPNRNIGSKKCALMLQKLKNNPGKLPLPDRNEMMKLLNDAKKGLKLMRA